MRKPHYHASIIKAWADGYPIEFYDEVIGYWRPTSTRVMPTWDPEIDYRIKQEKGASDDKDL
jgi:hypothetical protein